MRKIACLPDNDRREFFRNTADKMGLNDAIVEKDFWVCFTLDYLFHRCPWKNSITFKGGTSLSKALNHIQLYTTQKSLSRKMIPLCFYISSARKLKRLPNTSHCFLYLVIILQFSGKPIFSYSSCSDILSCFLRYLLIKVLSSFINSLYH